MAIGNTSLMLLSINQVIIFVLTIFYQNILQNVPNCIIFKNFLGGAYTPNSPSKRVALPRKYSPTFQKYFEPPPPPPEMKS